ncbi:MAG TPA: glucose-6-phosphate dehydrogenase [Vicinamibacterales bacterium]|nr:glucose-6-phosphate dehydrogenase [Vicinamibacterales bacterium]
MTISATPVNPLRAGLRIPRTPEPCALVVFGATGDLTARKLMPALYNLARERLLPAGFSVVGFARRPWTDADFRAAMREAIEKFSREPLQSDIWDTFARSLHYVSGTFGDIDGYERLGERLLAEDSAHGSAGNRVFYLATPPGAYAEIAHHLGEANLSRSPSGGWTRLVVEKPFGSDLESARKLDQSLGLVFRERQIFRIDHYLGKETVQNIMVFRFGNGIFEPIWNRRYVDNVQVSVAETVGLEGRGGYYDQSGALRDMVQNHLLQVLALVAMEPVATLTGEGVRDEKAKVLRAVKPIEDVDRLTVRAQYTAGAINGLRVPGYRDEPDVGDRSLTETYVALKLGIENWRWADVPFYLRVGKRLPKRATEVAITFRSAPLQLFREMRADNPTPNLLVLRIQPDEGISLRFGAKVPGTRMDVRPVNMDFRYGTSFGIEPPEAYERLLLDAMIGDSTLFTRWDSVEAAWEVLTPVLGAWAAGASPLHYYEAGTWGPDEARSLVERDGREWHRM